MIEFRPFLNSDSPGIVAVWNSQPPLRGRLMPMTCAMLEQHVLSKPYFDPQGLIVATQRDRVVGFVHAGWVPGDRPGELVLARGILSQLLVDPSARESDLALELLHRGEQYLRRHGAQEFLGGAVGWRGPFYLGMYGGSSLPGVLVDDDAMAASFRAGGYEPWSETRLLECALTDFRLPIDRSFLQLRRQFRLEPCPEQMPQRWCEVCAWSWVEREQLSVEPLARGKAAGPLTFWNMEPLSGSWGVRAVGLLDCGEPSTWMPPEMLPCFLGEALRHFQSQGVTLVAVQATGDEAQVLAACQRLGFRECGRGIQFRKADQAAGAPTGGA